MAQPILEVLNGRGPGWWPSGGLKGMRGVSGGAGGGDDAASGLLLYDGFAQHQRNI